LLTRFAASDAGRKAKPDERRAFQGPSISQWKVIEGLDFWPFRAYY
jgi:hypothetical protein